MSTGSTPRKRAWNVPATWQTTQPREALLQRYRTKLQDSQDDETNVAMNDDGEILYQTIGEASISMPAYTPESSEETATTPDTVPSTPVEENAAFSPASISSPLHEQVIIKAEAVEDFRGDDREQENIPPVAAFLPKEFTQLDNAKVAGLGLPKPKARTAHVRSNSTLGESVTGSNLPMRKTRRAA